MNNTTTNQLSDDEIEHLCTYRETISRLCTEGEQERDRLLAVMFIAGILVPSVGAVSTLFFGIGLLVHFVSYLASIGLHSRLVKALDAAITLRMPLPKDFPLSTRIDVLRVSNTAAALCFAGGVITEVFSRVHG